MSTAAVGTVRIDQNLMRVTAIAFLPLLPLSLLIGRTFGGLVFLGAAYIAATLYVAVRHPMQPLWRFFTFCAAIHAVVGFLLAEPTEIKIWIGSTSPQFYELSFAAIAGTLFISVLFANSMSEEPGHRLLRWMAYEFDERRLIVGAIAYCFLGIAIMAYIYGKIGVLPILSGEFGTVRYFTEEMSPTFARDEWMVSRAMDLLSYSVPLLVCVAFWTRKRWYILVGVIGFISLLLPLRRATLLSAISMMLLMQTIKTGRLNRKVVIVLVSMLALYAASNMVFMGGFHGSDSESSVMLTSAGSALPEVRDLGWTMYLGQDDLYWGATLIQPFVPLPSFISEFSQEYSLRNVTTRLVGLDEERTTGGLRITFAGECWLNFHYFGLPIAALIVGYLFGLVNRVMHAQRHTLVHVFLAAQFFVWVAFWFYLAGTQAAATIKVGIILLLALLWYAKIPTQRAETV